MSSSYRPRPRFTADEPGDSNLDEELSEQESAVLEIESAPWKYTASKERAIRDRLGIEPVDYYLILGDLLHDPRALRARPALMRRLADRVDRASGTYAPGRGGSDRRRDEGGR